MRSVFFHVDLDAFFASVEQTDNPALRGKPVIIGAAPGHRGVVAACSYEARRFGVRSAMPISEAYRRCPKGVYLPVRMERYHELSERVMSLFGDFTPEVRQISVDEASLDMTGTERLHGSSAEAASKLKERVHAETGLTISVGIAPNRYLAKLASEFKKPDGLFEVTSETSLEFLNGLALKDLWGVGKKTLARLEELGIRSVVELRRQSLEALQSSMGNASGSYLYMIARGEDPGIYRDERKSHSISSERTFEEDTDDEEALRRVVLRLSDLVMFRLIEEGVAAKTVFIKLRYSDFRTLTAQRSLPAPPHSADVIDRAAMDLLRLRWNGEPVRLLGVGVSAGVGEAEAPAQLRQGELFEEQGAAAAGPGSEASKRQRLEEAIHRIKLEGKNLVKASLLGHKDRRPGK